MTATSSPRVILDTNVFISALLFEGEISKIVPLWQNGCFLYLLSRPIHDEYLRVLAYPKFQLTDHEIKSLMEEELLPFVEIIAKGKKLGLKIPALRDKDDEIFLKAAIAGRADYLVTGDKELLGTRKIGLCSVITPSDFLRLFTISIKK